MTATEQDKLARIGKSVGCDSLIIPDWHGRPAVAPAKSDELVNLAGYIAPSEPTQKNTKAFYVMLGSPLYDYLEIAPNSAKREYQFFTNVETTSGKTSLHTNMDTNEKLDAPESFVVERIGVCFSPTTDPKTRAVFAESYWMSLNVEKRSYCQCPIAIAFSTAFSSDTETALHAQFKLDRPVLISHRMRFNVSIVGFPPKEHGRIKLWVALQGAHQATGFC